MSATSFHEYAQGVSDTLNSLLASNQASLVNSEIDQRSALRGFIKGILLFDDGSKLHFREFIGITLPDPRIMYAYHYQDVNKALVFRYDNAVHRPVLPEAQHKHTPEEVITTSAPTLTQVVEEILARI